MKKHTILILITMFVNVAVSQNSNIQDSIIKFIQNETYKNIAAFNVKYSIHSFNGIDKNNFLKTDRNFFYDAFIANDSFKLKMEIKQLDLTYPDKDYILYQIHIDGFRFINENDQIEQLKAISDVFPYNNYYLLALNPKTKSIKFLSGQFFKSNIAADFSFDRKNINSFFQYLLLRTYFLKTKNIIFKKIKGDKFYFKAYSCILNDDIEIELSYNNIENPEILIKKNQR